ncbi:thymidine kinase [Providencia rettgeri]|uniref:thymidine kinase n=1 Tax=Providencia rettgeri TaxID=587 RepID=UPI001F5128B6|nr:thymidine kinase [Providencia rettgeri]
MAQLYFYYSAMNAGKSTSLLQSSYNYNERGMRTVIFTAEIDNRFEQGKVSSRIGLSAEALLYSTTTNMAELIKKENSEQKVHCVLIDECQFLTKKQVEELCDIVDNEDIPVLCYGLRTDFAGQLFEGSQYLLAWADKLVELKTVCYCGRKALMNPLMILVKIIKLRWIHILSYDQMVSRKINNQTTRCANSIFYTTLFTNSAPNYT